MRRAGDLLQRHVAPRGVARAAWPFRPERWGRHGAGDRARALTDAGLRRGPPVGRGRRASSGGRGPEFVAHDVVSTLALSDPQAPDAVTPSAVHGAHRESSRGGTDGRRAAYPCAGRRRDRRARSDRSGGTRVPFVDGTFLAGALGRYIKPHEFDGIVAVVDDHSASTSLASIAARHGAVVTARSDDPDTNERCIDALGVSTVSDCVGSLHINTLGVSSSSRCLIESAHSTSTGWGLVVERSD